MRKIFSNKALAAVAVAAVAVTGTGVAYAYWTTSGSGSGSGKAAGTGGTLTLAGPETQVTGLVPGSSITIPITATNPAGNVTTLSADTLTASNLDSSDADCDALTEGAKATITDTDPAGLVTLASGASGGFGSVTITLPNSSDVNQDACKNATYTFDVAASYVGP